MSSAAQPNSTSQSGIAIDETGERLVPSTVRSDGSVRKERRIRPGYRPPEDVEIYKNRTAEAWKNRGKGGVPGAEHLTENTEPKQKKAPKKPKSEAIKRNEVEKPLEAENGAVPQQDLNLDEPVVDPEAEKEKEAKKLAKKLRQAKDLQKKKESGDALLPEQFEKVIRINELIRQLDSLGFDLDGKKRP